MQRGEDVRVVILAGGDGTRLASLTTTVDGVAVPKQYCSLSGGDTLLRATLKRAQRLVPLERVYVSVVDRHEPYWREELSDLPRANVIPQPANRGTGMGVLLPLLHIFRRAPDATVAVLPSDHHIDDEDTFEMALRRAISAARAVDNRVVVLGVSPDRPETDYGWILPDTERDDGTFDVLAFAEKPPRSRARHLMERGGLWSTLVCAGKLSAMFRLYDRAAHLLLHVFLRSFQRNPDPRNLESLYDLAPALDFSHDLLEACPELLRVQPVPSCGWSDLGSPERVAACLRQSVGRRARRLRLRRGMTEVDLARRSGLSPSMIASYEEGVTSVDPALSADLAAGLGVSVEDLLGLEDAPSRPLPSLSRPFLEAACMPPSLDNVVPLRRPVTGTEASRS